MQHGFGSRCAELDLWLCGFVNDLLCHGQTFLEDLFELLGQVENVASILVVLSCVAPDTRNLFLKRVPRLEVGLHCRCFAAVLSSYSLAHSGERHGLLDDLVVVGQGTGRKRDKGLEDFETGRVLVWPFAD